MLQNAITHLRHLGNEIKSVLAFPLTVYKGLENSAALNLHILSQNLDSRLNRTDLPLFQPCSNTHAL